MTGKIDKGRSILNAADENENPYGLVLSEEERRYIYGLLNTLDYRTSALLDARTGWRARLKATFSSLVEVAIVCAVATISNRYAMTILVVGFAFVILEKLNLLLRHEAIDQNHDRRNRENEVERKRRAQYFKDMGTTDMSNGD